MASRKTHYSFRTATALGVRELARRPKLSIPFLTITLTQGAVQALLIWTITTVLGGTNVFLGAALVLLLWSLRAWTAYLGMVLAGRLAYMSEIEAMGRVLRGVLRRPVSFFDEHSKGDLLISSYQDLTAIRSVTMSVGQMALQVSRIGALAAAAIYLSPKMALIGIACVPLVLVPAFRLGRSIKEAAQSERVRMAMLHDNFMQVVNGVSAVKVNRVGWRILQRARDVSDKLLKSMIGRAKLRGLSTFILETSAGVGLAIIIGVGGHDVAKGELEWQALVGILMAMVALYQPAIGFLGAYNSICSMIPRLDRIHHLRKQRSPEERRGGRMRIAGPPETITLENLSFGFGDVPVLDGISLCFDRGETIGIVGQTGAGKSTLMEVIMGLRPPTSGRVLYDGLDLGQYREKDLFGLMALVPQEPTLFLDSVGDNIRIGRFSAGQEEIEAAAKAAQIHDEILQMEEGYDTLIGEGAVDDTEARSRSLSVGQKQRIAIASAILKDAPLVFLDEATSSVDSATESRIQEATDHLVSGRTAFVIAHRLSTLRSASRIVVLHAGKVVGFGTHAELLESCTHYRDLWHSQSRPGEKPGAETGRPV